MKKALQSISFGRIKPTGWIRRQMQKDLNGFVGHLDQLAPELMSDDRIYGQHRLSSSTKSKNLGTADIDTDWEVQYLWWNSESQSNWWDGYLRHAFLLNDPIHLDRVEKFIEYILSTQDKDGYIGIYDPDLRYKFNSENGELWSKATLYRVLLAYYEATQRADVMQAIIRAVDNVMINYPIHTSAPFSGERSYAGVSHGLMFTDVLEKLWQVTGKPIYQDYAVFLFTDYCRQEVSEKDIHLKNILNIAYKLAGHGVHSYEHLRPLALAAFASGNKDLKDALAIYLRRIASSVTASGGPIGDEWIFERSADATDTGYEYCSIQELMDSYLFLLRKTDDLSFADKAERSFLNAAQGARHPSHSSIAYLKTDNSFEMTGTKNGIAEPNKKQTRYKYSPVHQDVAVCCSPNAGRITPYFIQNMWMKDKEGLVACLYGPCELETDYNGETIAITETTEYPFGYKINFEIVVSKSVSFNLRLRKPAWAKAVKMNVPFEEQEQFVSVNKQWMGQERITLDLEPALEINESADEVYFSYGPLVLAHPIEALETRTKDYKIPGFCDVHYKPVSLAQYEYNNGPFTKSSDELIFDGEFVNMDSNKKEILQLIPMGKTILRQVSFKKLN